MRWYFDSSSCFFCFGACKKGKRWTRVCYFPSHWEISQKASQLCGCHFHCGAVRGKPWASLSHSPPASVSWRSREHSLASACTRQNTGPTQFLTQGPVSSWLRSGSWESLSLDSHLQKADWRLLCPLFPVVLSLTCYQSPVSLVRWSP